MIDERILEEAAMEVHIPRGVLTIEALERLCCCSHHLNEHRRQSLHPASEAPCSHDDIGESCGCPEFVSIAEYRDLRPFARVA